MKKKSAMEEASELGQSTEEMLLEQVKGTVETVNDLSRAGPEEVTRFLTEDVLEIRREQTRLTGGWRTNRYILVVTTGGPHIEFDTDAEVRGFWAGETVTATAFEAEDFLKDELFQRLNEIFGER